MGARVAWLCRTRHRVEQDTGTAYPVEQQRTEPRGAYRNPCPLLFPSCRTNRAHPNAKIANTVQRSNGMRSPGAHAERHAAGGLGTRRDARTASLLHPSQASGRPGCSPAGAVGPARSGRAPYMERAGPVSPRRKRPPLSSYATKPLRVGMAGPGCASGRNGICVLGGPPARAGPRVEPFLRAQAEIEREGGRESDRERERTRENERE
jgi:hypothetical protein